MEIKSMEELNIAISQRDLVIYRTFHSTITEYSFFSSIYRNYTKYHIMAIKQTSASLQELKLYKIFSLTKVE